MKVNKLTERSLMLAFATVAVVAYQGVSDPVTSIIAGVSGFTGAVSLVTANVKPHDTWELGSLIKRNI
ncbi:MAG: hypothetical protein KAS59_00110 [Alphaproteobacteria bacterium]|nr:hypothetical protein [Alphaproteobacteria bacterium]